MSEKRIFQIVVAVFCLVPLIGGGLGIIEGMAFVHERNAGIMADSHFRYLSGLLFGVGVAILLLLPSVENRTFEFRLLTMMVVIGGLARLLSLVAVGTPPRTMLAALAMELIVTPVLCAWQSRIAQR